MIGKWRAESQITDAYGTHHVEYFVKFINHHKLRFYMDDPIELFCAAFTYKVIEDDLLLVENRRTKGSIWRINRQNNDFLISIWNDEGCLVFTRDTSTLCWEDIGFLR